jgi:hypothetical protein
MRSFTSERVEEIEEGKEGKRKREREKDKKKKVLSVPALCAKWPAARRRRCPPQASLF